MEASVGKPLDRVDGRLKVTGRAFYSAEHPVPDVVHGVLLMSTIAKGRVEAMDTRAAERSPGVLAVLTPFNAPKLPDQKAKGGGAQGRPTDRVLHLLQDDLVHYSNQPIGIVVADSLERAAHAAELVKVKYAGEPHEVVLDKLLSQAYTPKTAGTAGPAEKKRGDVEAGLTQGKTRIEQVYGTPTETHNPMEPHATIAVWDGPKLTLFDATQGVYGDRTRVASVLGIRPEDIHVVSPFLGGGFGSKGPTWSHVVLAAMAAREVKRPVKVELRRHDLFGPLGFRSETRQTIALAAMPDATLTGMKHEVVSQTSDFDEFVEAATAPSRMLYACPNFGVAQKLVRLNTGTPSFMRAPGEAPGTFAIETAMDELAWELKVDPIELRLKNYAEQDPDEGHPWSSKSLRECYRIGAERFGWQRWKMETRARREGNRLIGLGMATATYPTRRSEAAARAVLQADGRVIVEAGTQDLGTGTYTVMTQVAADAVGVDPKRVTFRLGDTNFPEGPVSGGSQTAASVGSAVKLAGQALQEKLIQMASSDAQSPLSGAGANDVAIDGDRLVLKSNPGRGETLKALLQRRGVDQVEAQASSKPGEEKKEFSMHAFGAQFAEVHVDADLGMVRVNRMVGVFGAGKILNAKTARSQLMGGMIWGVGMALTETTVMDAARGRYVNMNLAEYHVPVNADAPGIEVVFVDEVDPHVNPAGVKGIGEIGITGAAAAIGNAIYHATGKRVRDLPITPDKLI